MKTITVLLNIDMFRRRFDNQNNTNIETIALLNETFKTVHKKKKTKITLGHEAIRTKPESVLYMKKHVTNS